MTPIEPKSQARNDILIVDDNPENLKVLGDFLEEQGYNVRVSRDGKQALSNAQASPPELVLLDIHMPVMDGYEACAAMKATSELASIPIIFLSALGETFNKVQAFECGGADYITKPFNLEEVRVRIQNQIQIHRLLAESRAGFRASFEQAAAGMAHVSLDGRLVTANKRMSEMFECGIDALLAMRLEDLAAEASKDILVALFERAREEGEATSPRHIQCARPDGANLWCRFTFSRIVVPTTENEYIAAIVEDVTEYKTASEERRTLAAALEQATEAVAVLNPRGAIEYMNASFVKAFGGEGEIRVGDTLPVLDEASEESGTTIRAALASGSPWGGRIRRTTEDDEERVEEYSISPVRTADDALTHFVAIARDLSAQIRLEEQLRQAQKMEAIGTLAAGIAHDFNNVLTGISGFTELSREELPEGHPVRENLDEVMLASNHAADLVRQILSFARQAPYEARAVRVQDVLEDALRLLRRSIPPTIEIRQSVESETGHVFADPTAIHQIIMNLCTNAYHAMERNGGTLSVSLSEVAFGDEPPYGNEALALGRYARLDISDTGHGMDKATVARIFDPYFTTKARGSGTGLGLATVHGIVSDLKGTIHVYSEVDSGTTFSVLIPITTQGSTNGGDSDELPKSLAGSERVLFVDDERALCQLARKALGKLGYDVTAFESAGEALAYLREDPDRVDLAITDEMMPGMRGSDLLVEFRAIRPSMPVILYSGFSERFRTAEEGEPVFDAYVMKPMVVSQLTQAMRNVLDGPGKDQ